MPYHLRIKDSVIKRFIISAANKSIIADIVFPLSELMNKGHATNKENIYYLHVSDI